jgi:F0F1-type ATP synthase epsilon subunit
VLASSAESPETVDASAASAEVQQADEKFSNLSFYDPAYQAAQEALQLARARVEAANLESATR